MSTPIPRVGGRLLLLDPDDRLLLIHERYDGVHRHWLTPGGGVEDGEHPRDAAVREALEETGIVVELAPDAEAVLVTRREWGWRELLFDQVDHFFLARVPHVPDPRPHAPTEVEQQTLLGMRWWTPTELLATDEVLLPAHLGTVVRDLLG